MFAKLCSFLGGFGRGSFSFVYLYCWQNSVSWGCQTMAPISLLVVRWRPSLAFETTHILWFVASFLHYWKPATATWVPFMLQISLPFFLSLHLSLIFFCLSFLLLGLSDYAGLTQRIKEYLPIFKVHNLSSIFKGPSPLWGNIPMGSRDKGLDITVAVFLPTSMVNLKFNLPWKYFWKYIQGMGNSKIITLL